MPFSLRHWFSRTFRRSTILATCRKAARLYDKDHPDGFFTSACFVQAAEGTGLLSSADGHQVYYLLKGLPFVEPSYLPGHWTCAMQPDPVPFGWTWL